MDIVQSMNIISLEDEEEGGLEFLGSTGDENGMQVQGFNPELCVVGRFISEGKVEFAAMQQTMAALWKPGKGVYMKELDMNLYLFQFYHEIDVKRVMEGCPWSFNRRALVLARLKNGENPRNVDLNKMEVWIQVHDLKIGFMSEKIIQGIGNYVGEFIKGCPNNFAEVWRDYMRIRVSIDLRKPLKRRMKIKMAGDEWFWANFKYENIPTFCFICGIVGHSEKFCSKLFEMPENNIVKPYGPWMRAPFRNQVKPIGAKWLRNGMETGDSSSGMERQDATGEQDGFRQDPRQSPLITETGRQGEDKGIANLQNIISRAGNEFGNNSVTNAQIITEQLNQRNVSVIETKKRRAGDGLGIDNCSGQNKDIIMTSEEDNLVLTDEATTDKNNGSKNGLLASTHGSARLSL